MPTCLCIACANLFPMGYCCIQSIRQSKEQPYPAIGSWTSQDRIFLTEDARRVWPYGYSPTFSDCDIRWAHSANIIHGAFSQERSYSECFLEPLGNTNACCLDLILLLILNSYWVPIYIHTCNASTGNHFYKQPVLQATGSTGNQFYRQLALQATSSTETKSYSLQKSSKHDIWSVAWFPLTQTDLGGSSPQQNLYSDPNKC